MESCSHEESALCLTTTNHARLQLDRALIVAEPGSTHDGHLLEMVHLIELAKCAGANAVKFQWTSNAQRLAQRRDAPQYGNAYKKIAFKREWLHILADICSDVGIVFACTVYLKEDVEVVAPLVDFFKVSSFESADYELLAEMERYSKPIIVSLGARTSSEINGIMDSRPDEVFGSYYWLHCVSSYPCPPESLHLGRLALNLFSGFSDHSCNTLTGAIAVAAGAQILEVHMRHPRTKDTNADFKVSLLPDELAEYIKNVRATEVMLWGPTGMRKDATERVVQECERPMRKFLVDHPDFV